MRKPMFREKVRHSVEAILTAVLFGTQTILNAGWAISVMAIPILSYLTYLLMGQANPEREIQVLFFAKEFVVGRTIALVGFAVLSIAGAQFLLNRSKGLGLIRTGLYSRIRHPQFMGIAIIAIGLTVMVFTLETVNQPQIIGMWLIQTLGYIGIARYEEAHLLKRFGESFRQYKRDIPFMFPIKCPTRIPETLFTILIAALICFFFSVFPFDLIRIL